MSGWTWDGVSIHRHRDMRQGVDNYSYRLYLTEKPVVTNLVCGDCKSSVVAENPITVFLGCLGLASGYLREPEPFPVNTAVFQKR